MTAKLNTLDESVASEEGVERGVGVSEDVTGTLDESHASEDGVEGGADSDVGGLVSARASPLDDDGGVEDGVGKGGVGCDETNAATPKVDDASPKVDGIGPLPNESSNTAGEGGGESGMSALDKVNVLDKVNTDKVNMLDEVNTEKVNTLDKVNADLLFVELDGGALYENLLPVVAW